MVNKYKKKKTIKKYNKKHKISLKHSLNKKRKYLSGGVYDKSPNDFFIQDVSEDTKDTNHAEVPKPKVFRPTQTYERGVQQPIVQHTINPSTPAPERKIKIGPPSINFNDMLSSSEDEDEDEPIYPNFTERSDTAKATAFNTDDMPISSISDSDDTTHRNPSEQKGPVPELSQNTGDGSSNIGNRPSTLPSVPSNTENGPSTLPSGPSRPPLELPPNTGDGFSNTGNGQSNLSSRSSRPVRPPSKLPPNTGNGSRDSTPSTPASSRGSEPSTSTLSRQPSESLSHTKSTKSSRRSSLSRQNTGNLDKNTDSLEKQEKLIDIDDINKDFYEPLRNALVLLIKNIKTLTQPKSNNTLLNEIDLTLENNKFTFNNFHDLFKQLLEVPHIDGSNIYNLVEKEINNKSFDKKKFENLYNLSRNMYAEFILNQIHIYQDNIDGKNKYYKIDF